LLKAASLYRGDFLDSLYLPDSNPFEEWAAARREAMRRGALSVLERLAAMAVADNDYASAEGYARRQLTIDPLHEAANRQLIEILARSGRRVAAISHFEGYQRLLHIDLDIPPGAALPMRPAPAERRAAIPIAAIHPGAARQLHRHRVRQRAVQRRWPSRPSPLLRQRRHFIRRFESEAQVTPDWSTPTSFRSTTTAEPGTFCCRATCAAAIQDGVAPGVAGRARAQLSNR
jgi:hypothetical protein